MKILLAEDHPELAKSIAGYLAQGHHICGVAATFAAAREKLASFAFDCVVLGITPATAASTPW